MIKKLTCLIVCLAIAFGAYAAVEGYYPVAGQNRHINQLLRNLYRLSLPVAEKVFTTAPTTDTLPDQTMGFYDDGTDQRVYFNMNGTVGYIPFGSAYRVKNSVEVDSDNLQLVGDSSAPGNNKFYGTSSAGTKGWESNVCRIKTGTYTGDGTTGQAITGIGFQPKYLKIWARPSSEATTSVFEKVDDSWGDFCISHASGGSTFESFDNRINSFDPDGFTVDDDGTDEHPNKNNTVYSYLCLGN